MKQSPKKKQAKELARKDLKKTKGGSGEILAPANPRSGTLDMEQLSNLSKAFADQQKAIIDNLKG